jgi:hypothetical protein
MLEIFMVITLKNTVRYWENERSKFTHIAEIPVI